MAALTLVTAIFLGGCKPRNQYQTPPPADVTIQMPVQRDVTDYLEQTGQLAPVKTVNLVARIQGALEEIGYQDGSFVKQGANLFTIEPPPFKAQLDQARATLSSNQAKAAFAVLQKERYSTLARTSDASRMQAQQTLSDSKAADAAVLQAQAGVETAAITYTYTHVLAPFDGVVTAHMQDIGALVGGSQPTQLATIMQLDPIWVNFNISEQDVLSARARMAIHGTNASDLPHVAVQIALQDETGYPHSGYVDYTAPAVDTGTGTLAVRGIFSNSDHRLLPGYYVRIRIPIGETKGALLVPDDAIGSGQGGRTVLVVNTKNVVEQRNVTLGTKQGDLRLIETGLKQDDRVIVDGLQRARAGEQVVPHEAAAPTAADAMQKQG